MATNYTPLLGLALPTTGELSGTWGQVVNDSITELVEDSIAGSATASVTSGNWTLSTTGSGAANEARCAILIPTGTPGVSRNIIAPASSKAYIVDNQSDGAVVIKGAATTGATVAAGAKALVAWNGTDFVVVSTSTADGVTSVSGTGTVNGITLSGTVTSTGNLTLGGTLSNVDLTTQVTGTLPIGNGGTGATTAPNARTNLGATTLGSNLFTITNPSAITFPRFNADNTVSALNATDFRTAIGAGSGAGTVTSVAATAGSGISVSGSPITTSGTLTITNTGVTSITASTGISASASTGGVTLTNTGVTSVTGGTGITVSASTGGVTISASGGGGNLQETTYSTSSNFVVPTGVTKVYVEVIGGGGGSAAGPSTGGGGGGYAAGILTVTPGTTVAVTVGAGGTGNQPYGSTGNTGGASSFSTVSANGGTGSGSSGSGYGGNASGGTHYNVSGGMGQYIPIANQGVPGMAGVFSTYAQTARGPGAGGFGQGNSFGTPGTPGQVTVWYVGS